MFDKYGNIIETEDEDEHRARVVLWLALFFVLTLLCVFGCIILELLQMLLMV